MRDLAIGIVVSAIVIGGSLIVRDTYGSRRWELLPAPGGNAYRLDRASGNVSLCSPLFCRMLPTVVPAPSGGATQPSPKRQTPPPRRGPDAPATGT